MSPTSQDRSYFLVCEHPNMEVAAMKNDTLKKLMDMKLDREPKYQAMSTINGRCCWYTWNTTYDTAKISNGRSRIQYS